MKPLYLVVNYQPDQWNCCIWWSFTNLISETVVSGGHLPTWSVKLLYLVVIYQPDQWNCCIWRSFTNLISETVVSGGHLQNLQWLKGSEGQQAMSEHSSRATISSVKSETGFLLGIFSGGAKSIVMQISIVILLFLDQISGRGESFQGGQTASGGGAPCPPCGRKPGNMYTWVEIELKTYGEIILGLRNTKISKNFSQNKKIRLNQSFPVSSARKFDLN